jgi:hypothetical protein
MKLPKSKAKLEVPKVKVPKALADLYRELRGQHLLPIVALLIASLIAIPILLNEPSDVRPPAAPPATASGSSTASTLTATRFSPGLRNYQGRLSSREPVDPFANGLTPADSETESGSGEETSGGEVPAAPEMAPPSESPANESTETPSKPSKEPTPQGPEAGNADSGDRINVEVAAIQLDGSAQSESVRYHQPELTKLPSDSVPALTYVGPSDDGTKAMMLVSPQVSALAGASKCVVPAEPCQLLALQLAAPETLVFGPDQLTYRIELVKIGGLSQSQASSLSKGAPGDKTAIGRAMAARAH